MILIPVLLMLLPASEGPALTGFPELVAPAPLQEEEAEVETPKWTGSLALGANWSGGNTRTEGVNGTFDTVYRRANDRTTLGAFSAYSKNRIHEVINEERYGARAQYDYFISEKTYALVQTSYDVDAVASLRSRVTAGAGLGRQFREDETLKLSGEAGLTWKDEEFPHGQGGDDITLRLAYDVTWIPNEQWELSQSVSVLPVLDDFADVYTLADTRVKATITGSMFGQLQYLLENDETPAAGKQRTDHRVLLAVGWSF